MTSWAGSLRSLGSVATPPSVDSESPYCGRSAYMKTLGSRMWARRPRRAGWRFHWQARGAGCPTPLRGTFGTLVRAAEPNADGKARGSAFATAPADAGATAPTAQPLVAVAPRWVLWVLSRLCRASKANARFVGGVPHPASREDSPPSSARRSRTPIVKCAVPPSPRLRRTREPPRPQHSLWLRSRRAALRIESTSTTDAR